MNATDEGFDPGTLPELLAASPHARWDRFDSGDSRDRWLVEVVDAGGMVRRLLVPDSIRLLADMLGTGRPLSQVLDRMQHDGLPEGLRPLIEQQISERLIPSGLLIDASQPAPPATARRVTPSYMSMMLPLLPARWINLIASWGQWLFAPRALVAGVAAGAVGLFLLLQELLSGAALFDPRSSEVIAAIGLGLLGLLFHELGHALAAFRFGARKVDIGIGWYIVMPVAYADLSEAWRFSRWQRAIVDMAGIVLQALWLLLLMLVFHANGSIACLAAATATATSIAWNLNPLVRMDGYWLVTDLLGVTHLRREALTALRQLSGRKAPGGDPISHWRMRLLAIYSVAASVFFVALLVWGCRRFATSLTNTIPALWARLLDDPWSELGAADYILLALLLLWNCVMVAMLGRFIGHTLLSAAQWGTRKLTTLARAHGHS